MIIIIIRIIIIRILNNNNNNDCVAARVEPDGRIVYVGAGSSGRMRRSTAWRRAGGTFGWPEDRIVFLLAGGHDLSARMPGGVEDDARIAACWTSWSFSSPSGATSVIAVTASGTTPFTVARRRGEARPGRSPRPRQQCRARRSFGCRPRRFAGDRAGCYRRLDAHGARDRPKGGARHAVEADHDAASAMSTTDLWSSSAPTMPSFARGPSRSWPPIAGCTSEGEAAQALDQARRQAQAGRIRAPSPAAGPGRPPARGGRRQLRAALAHLEWAGPKRAPGMPARDAVRHEERTGRACQRDSLTEHGASCPSRQRRGTGAIRRCSGAALRRDDAHHRELAQRRPADLEGQDHPGLREGSIPTSRSCSSRRRRPNTTPR